METTMFNGTDLKTAKILQDEFNMLREDLIQRYDQLNMRASGNFERMLEVEVTDTSAILWGPDYTEQLEHGRGPNSGKTGKTWENPVKDIEQWLIDKGVGETVKSVMNGESNQEREIKRNVLAFLIARKIARYGYDRAGQGGVELLSKVVTPERIQSILDRISDIYVINFTNYLTDYLNDIF